MIKYLIAIAAATALLTQVRTFFESSDISLHMAVFVSVVTVTIVASLIAYRIIQLKTNSGLPRKKSKPKKDDKISAHGTIRRG